VDDHVSAADVDIVLEAQRHAERREGVGEITVEGGDARDSRALARGEDDDLVPGRTTPEAIWPL